VNIAQAALGDVITVPTLDGEDQLTIPAGIQAGTARCAFAARVCPASTGADAATRSSS
jgi:hypothetical protein